MISKLRYFYNTKIYSVVDKYYNLIDYSDFNYIKKDFNSNFEYLNLIHKIYNSNRSIFNKSNNDNNLRLKFYEDLEQIKNDLEHMENKFYEDYISNGDIMSNDTSILFSYYVYFQFHKTFDLNKKLDKNEIFEFLYKINKTINLIDKSKIEANSILRLAKLLLYYDNENYQLGINQYFPIFNNLLTINLEKYSKINDVQFLFLFFLLSSNYFLKINNLNLEIKNFMVNELFIRNKLLKISQVSQISFSLYNMSIYHSKILEFVMNNYNYYKTQIMEELMNNREYFKDNKFKILNLINLVYYYESSNRVKNKIGLDFLEFFYKIDYNFNKLNNKTLNSLLKLFILLIKKNNFYDLIILILLKYVNQIKYIKNTINSLLGMIELKKNKISNKTFVKHLDEFNKKFKPENSKYFLSDKIISIDSIINIFKRANLNYKENYYFKSFHFDFYIESHDIGVKIFNIKNDDYDFEENLKRYLSNNLNINVIVFNNSNDFEIVKFIKDLNKYINK